jgi:hypothetical protein
MKPVVMPLWLTKPIRNVVKAQYDKNVKPRVFSEGDLVLLYDQESDKLGAGKFNLMDGPLYC